MHGTPEDRRRETADRIGFSTYGVAQDMPDPVASGIDAMLDHIDSLERRQDELEALTKRLSEQLGEQQTDKA